MRTLLIIDDSQDDLELLKESLADVGIEGINLIIATDGDDGLAAIEAHTPDLVLLDLNMPRMHGWAVLDELRRRKLAVRVVVCSTSNNEEDYRESIARGARAYLAKPSDYSTMVESIRRTIAFWAIAR